MLLTLVEGEALQRDLDTLGHWIISNGIKFNKCQGQNNDGHKFRLWDKMARNLLVRKRFGVLVNCRLNISQQWALAAKSANYIFGYVKYVIASLSKVAINSLYLVLVRSHLEYYMWFWVPQYKNYIKILDCIQRRVTKLVKGMKDKFYEEKLRMFGLSSLEKMRSRGDLVALCNLLRRRNWEWGAGLFFLLTDDRMHGNGTKL